MTIRIGPFSTDSTLKMAAVAKDYHPAHVLPRLAREAGHRGLVLHSCWISLFADAAIRTVASGTTVTALKIRYGNPAFQRDLLTLEIAPAGGEETSEANVFSFEIFNGQRQRIASGTAELRR